MYACRLTTDNGKAANLEYGILKRVKSEKACCAIQIHHQIAILDVAPKF